MTIVLNFPPRISLLSSQFPMSLSHNNQRHRIREQSQPHEPTSLHKPPDFSRARLPQHCFSDRRPLRYNPSLARAPKNHFARPHPRVLPQTSPQTPLLVLCQNQHPPPRFLQNRNPRNLLSLRKLASSIHHCNWKGSSAYCADADYEYTFFAAEELVTVSGAVVLFALRVSLVFQAENRETLTATATYAAVLVVFVRTSGAGA
jgi:hypothetical protein